MRIFQKNQRSCNRFINFRQHDRAFLLPDFLTKLPVKPPYMVMGPCTAKFVYITAMQFHTSWVCVKEGWIVRRARHSRQRGWKHQNVLFPKNSYAFASGASHSVSYGPALISDTARVHVANKKQIIFPGKPRINYTYGECCWQMQYQFYLHVIYAGA